MIAVGKVLKSSFEVFCTFSIVFLFLATLCVSICNVEFSAFER
jgi:hypothetical protein